MGGNRGRSIREHLRRRSRRPKPAAPRGPGKATKSRLSPRSLSVEDLVRGLQGTPAGEKISVADLEADLEAGFPPNPDGTIDLVGYIAWLLRRHGYGRSSSAGGAG